MDQPYKILVTGVGGQGVVFLTNLLVKSALLANIPVATSEIYGLTQRGGSVSASITLGDDTYGFLEKCGVDILFGLEPLEAQRCVSFLNEKSVVIIDNNRILPHDVNSGSVAYPDIKKFVNYLKKNIEKVIFITENQDCTKSILRDLYVLGRTCSEIKFPIHVEFIEKAILEITRGGFQEKGLEFFELGLKKN
jgi:indolepyruvate ferredoxin oxidoreductase, beta subunit